MRRKSAADRREDIIGAAAQVLLDRGLLAATTRDVAERLGMSSGLLNHYFNWSELRSLAFGRLVDADRSRALSSHNHEPADVVLAAFVQTCFAPEYDALWRLWIEAMDLGRSDANLGAQLRRCDLAWHQGFADLIRRGNGERVWRCNDADGAALRLIALISGLAGLTLMPNAHVSRQDAIRHLGVAVRYECAAPVQQAARRRLSRAKRATK